MNQKPCVTPQKCRVIRADPCGAWFIQIKHEPHSALVQSLERGRSRINAHSTFDSIQKLDVQGQYQTSYRLESRSITLWGSAGKPNFG